MNVNQNSEITKNNLFFIFWIISVLGFSLVDYSTDHIPAAGPIILCFWIIISSALLGKVFLHKVKSQLVWIVFSSIGLLLGVIVSDIPPAILIFDLSLSPFGEDFFGVLLIRVIFGSLFGLIVAIFQCMGFKKIATIKKSWIVTNFLAFTTGYLINFLLVYCHINLKISNFVPKLISYFLVYFVYKLISSIPYYYLMKRKINNNLGANF